MLRFIVSDAAIADSARAGSWRRRLSSSEVNIATLVEWRSEYLSDSDSSNCASAASLSSEQHSRMVATVERMPGSNCAAGGSSERRSSSACAADTRVSKIETRL